MATNGKRVIHAGGIFPNPTLNREGNVTTTFMPGAVIVFDNGLAKPSVDGTDAAIKYVANFDYLRCRTVDDQFAVNDYVVGIHPIAGMYLNIRAEAGAYKKGEALVIANGQVKAGGDANSQFYAEESLTISTSGDLLRVVVK